MQTLKRLATMPPREWAHRLREKGNSEWERSGLGRKAWEAPQGIAFKQYLAAAPAQRFYFSDPERIRAFVQSQFPQWIDRATIEAEKLCRHEVELLGYGTMALGDKIDWHRDPVTGRTWERRFWTDYRPEHDPEGRDSKIIHELNRQQHLPRLAKAYLFTGDERYADEAVAQLESWIEQNPPGLGINWQSSLEIGIRAISWMWTMFLLLPSQALTEASAERIGKSLFAQLEHVYRYTSDYSSPNTHLIGEAAALFLGGLVFHDQKRAAAWMERGAVLLSEQGEKQVLDDGVHGELSTCYHCYTLDFYLQALVLAERNRFAFPDKVRQQTRGMLRFLMHLTRPDGTLPLLGDDDGGRAMAMEAKNYGSFNEALCVGSILFNEGDFKHQAGEYCEEAFWLLGEEGRRRYGAIGAAPPRETQALFPNAGYLIQRSGWGPRDSHLVFDCGGLGMLNGGHAHADALSIILFNRGEALLIDPGTFVYNFAPEWREYFRSTRAHNTVAIDSRDQAEQGGTFRWTTKISSRVKAGLTPPPAEYVEAGHDGYARMAQGVIHRRRLLHVPSEYWVVVDDFRGRGEHTFDLHYHLAPGVGVTAFQHDGANLVVRAADAGFLLGLYASTQLDAELIRGETAPIEGWVSHGYGEKQPGSTVRASFAGRTTTAVMSFLSVSDTAPALRRLNVEDQGAIVCSCRLGEFEDLVIFSTGKTEIRVGHFRMRGEFFWLRMRGGKLQQKVAIRARTLTHGGRDILEGALCAASLAS